MKIFKLILILLFFLNSYPANASSDGSISGAIEVIVRLTLTEKLNAGDDIIFEDSIDFSNSNVTH